MGVYDRDYYRTAPTGGLMSGVAPVCKWLIAINVAVYILQLMAGDRPGGITDWLVLARGPIVGQFQVWRLLTYAFCHDPDTIWHILGNMWFLWICGSQIEPIYGPREFLRFYLTSAVLSGLAFLIFELAVGRNAPLLGASGAVMAVTMVCAMYYPTMKIIVMFVLPIELRWLVTLYVIIGTYFMTSQLGGRDSLDQVAHATHLGGLLYGYLYKRFDLRYARLLAGWSWPQLRRLARTAARRKPDSVRIYEPPEERVPTPELSRRVDEILEKISAQGESSLTESEREVLKEASRRYKKH
jgi:rhomboid family protein